MPFEFKPVDHDILICPACAGWDVHITAWVHALTGEVLDDEMPLEDGWCATCEEQIGQIYASEANAAQRNKLMDRLDGFALALCRRSDFGTQTFTHILGLWYPGKFSAGNVEALISEWILTSRPNL